MNKALFYIIIKSLSEKIPEVFDAFYKETLPMHCISCFHKSEIKE